MKYKLKEFCRVINGRAYKQSELLDAGKYLVLRVGNFFSSDRFYYSDLELDKDKYCHNGDLLFTWACSFRPQIWNGGDNTIFHYHIWKLEENKNIVDRTYLYYLLLNSVKRMTAGLHGSVMLHITKSDMENFEFDLPTLDNQRKIASILKSIDDKIAINNDVNQNLEKQAVLIFKKLVSSSDFSKPLGEFINIKHGYAFKGDYISTEDNGVVLVTPGNFCIGGGFKENKCKFFNSDYPQEYVLKPESLIVTMTDLSKEADTLGFSALVPQSNRRIYLHNQRIGLVQQLNNRLPLSYIYWFLRSYEYHMNIVGSASGSTVKHTSPGRILEQYIPIPREEEMKRYCSIFDGFNDTISNNNEEIINLQFLRDALLPGLMTGEIDVSEIKV